MARTDKSAPSSHRADDERPDQDADKTPDESGEALDGGVGALRLWMSQALASTQTMMETFTQMQQLQARSLGAWGEMLESALLELQQARDAQALMSAAMKFGTRQWVLGYQQVGEAMSQLMDTEVQLANRLRGEAATVARQMMPAGAGGLASFGAAGDSQDASPLAQLGRLQDQWLASAQRWMDVGQSTARH